VYEGVSPSFYPSALWPQLLMVVLCSTQEFFFENADTVCSARIMPRTGADAKCETRALCRKLQR
jgi:hypothetical protein